MIGWAVAALGGFVIVLAVLLGLQRRQGRLEGDISHDRQEKSAVVLAQDVRDRLRRDADFAGRVRRRFSR